MFSIRNQGTQDVELQVTPLVYTDVDVNIYDGGTVLAVFLVPVNPDILGITDAKLQFDIWTGDVDVEISAITVKDLTPGDELEFGMAAIAFPEEAIDQSSIDNELVIAAEEV
ncbi:hypothetical protein C472_13162 [Halorubrum tebenquichense DSM 14210]|uniref:Uncharacterized protein n=1 Tax=Halorubrum tebenquichense DSM 14210 TaxID=1227485 RepID=M0DIQ0_9EURY|nr:hypothetical protein C472_13162 [Halorubrum tebenquichense DSM 14210]